MFWFVRYRIPYQTSGDEPSERLSRTLAQEKWKRISHEVTTTRVVLEHRLPFYLHNSWNPIFAGRFVGEGPEKLLVGYFRVNWFVFGLITIFLSFALFQLVSAILAPSDIPGFEAGWKDREVEWSLGFFAMAVAINFLGWAFGIPYERRILEALRESAAS
jgi:hypothetical protein